MPVRMQRAVWQIRVHDLEEALVRNRRDIHNLAAVIERLDVAVNWAVDRYDIAGADDEEIWAVDNTPIVLYDE